MPNDEELKSNKNIVYKITNKLNEKSYIGISVFSFKQRYNRKLKSHHNPHLRKSVNKYGEENFYVEILEKDVEDLETLHKLEMYYIEKFKTFDPKFGYNKTLGGDGVRHTEETKEKVRRALKGKIRSEEHCKNLSKAKMGINSLANLSQEKLKERSRKLSIALSGKNNPMYGRKTSMETKEKISHSSAGENNPMFGKNIKDYMTPEAYEQWKLNVARHGKDNGRAKKTVVVYKNEKYEFDYAQEAITYFKNLGEPITRYWFYKGVSEKHKDTFQFVGYEEDFKHY